MAKMMVKEILIESAILLGLTNGKQYLEGKVLTETAKQEAEELLRCFNCVENELALDYLPLYAETEVETETGFIDYKVFPNAIVRVLRVRDESGTAVDFKLFPNGIKTVNGKVTINYTYAPAQKALTEYSDFVAQASKRLLAYGVAAEYALVAGDFESAAVWDKKYKDAVEAAYRSKPSRILRSRRWA